MVKKVLPVVVLAVVVALASTGGGTAQVGQTLPAVTRAAPQVISPKVDPVVQIQTRITAEVVGGVLGQGVGVPGVLTNVAGELLGESVTADRIETDVVGETLGQGVTRSPLSVSVEGVLGQVDAESQSIASVKATHTLAKLTRPAPLALGNFTLNGAPTEVTTSPARPALRVLGSSSPAGASMALISADRRAPKILGLIVFNQPPVAYAGLDQTVIIGNIALLDGTGSSDPDEGDTLSYIWTLLSVPAGSSATLEDGGSATPSLSPDIPGDYVAQLVVNDGAESSPPDQVIIAAVTPAEAFQNLIGLVDGMVLPKGVQNSLSAPLKKATDLLNDGNPKNDTAACGKLAAFINQVGAKEGNGQLTENQAGSLRQLAGDVQAALGCKNK